MSVYLIDGGNGRWKIGTANDPEKRLRDLQAASPVPLRLVAVGPGGRPREAALHIQFERCRLHGEWFRLGKQVDYAAALVRGEAELRRPYAQQMEAKSASRARAKERRRASGVIPRDGRAKAGRVTVLKAPADMTLAQLSERFRSNPGVATTPAEVLADECDRAEP